jgi:hypothetical protein
MHHPTYYQVMLEQGVQIDIVGSSPGLVYQRLYNLFDVSSSWYSAGLILSVILH